jgi:glucosamine--fructose-6-phosphate aminotransferase (isomerizing)
MNAFLKEVLGQPEALARVRDFYAAGEGRELLDKLAHMGGQAGGALGGSSRRPAPPIVFTGMGSSLFAAYPAVRLLSERGLPASMIETSELLHYHLGGLPADAIVVLVSQSGETIEVERLLHQLPGRDRLVAVTNGPGSTLARAGALALPMEAGPPQQGVSARAYHNTLAVLLLAAEALSGGSGLTDRLGPAADAMAAFLKGASGLGAALDAFVGNPVNASVLARGPSLASAYQGALNLKELAKLAAEPMSAAHFRHGPIEVASPDHVSVIYAPLGATFTLLRKLAEELLGYGARVVFITDTQDGLQNPGSGLHVIRHGRLDETLAPLVNLAPMQLLASARAERLGYEVGRLGKAAAVMRVE